jgi:hypothetical protein
MLMQYFATIFKYANGCHLDIAHYVYHTMFSEGA